MSSNAVQIQKPIQESKKTLSRLLDTDLGRYVQNNLVFGSRGILSYPDLAFNIFMGYKEIEDDILKLEVYPDDIWLITYPKCGTTWTQEMVWLIVNDLDFEGAKVDLDIRFPFLEVPAIRKEYMEAIDKPIDGSLEFVKSMKRPRLIKTHLPVGLLPQQLWQVNPKIIYVMRDPKEAAMSFLNHYRILYGYTGSKEKFFDAFMSDNLLFGSYWNHLENFWRMRHQSNVLFNNFEEMKKDLPAVIHRTAKFLNKYLDESKMSKLLEHLKFSSMKDNEFVNKRYLAERLKKVHGVAQNQEFINNGGIKNDKEKMSPEWIKRFDDWKKEEKIKRGLNDVHFV